MQVASKRYERIWPGRPYAAQGRTPESGAQDKAHVINMGGEEPECTRQCMGPCLIEMASRFLTPHLYQARGQAQ